MAKQVDIGPRGGAWLLVVCSVLVACSPGCKTSGLQDEQADGCPSTVTSSSRDAGDADGDGVRSVACGGGDCDDADPSVFTGASEVSGDAIDQNCDGRELCYADGDGDGYGNGARKVFSAALACDVAGLSPSGDDCDDMNPRKNPGVVEICGDEIDQNCDGISDFDDERCDYNSIGCVSSAFADLSDGVAYALEHGLSSVYVCAGNYEESETVEIGAGFTLIGDTASGGVHLHSSAQPVIGIARLETGRVRLDGIGVECASRVSDGVYFDGSMSSETAELERVGVELVGVHISGCNVAFSVYPYNAWPYAMTVEDVVISGNNQGTIVASNVVGRFRRVTYAENSLTGAVALYAEHGGGFDLDFDECSFSGNRTATGGAALNLAPFGSDTESVGTVILQDCEITGNTSNESESSAGSGAVMMYFREHDQPAVTMYGGSITENVAALGERASGIHIYTGTFEAYDVDFGLGESDNIPVDVDGIFGEFYEFGTSASFFCDATVWGSLYCED